jgi:hypothetical protein
MALNTTYRTNESEIMDDFQLEGDELRDALDKIAKINQLLGGNKLTLLGVRVDCRQSETAKSRLLMWVVAMEIC